MSEVLFIRYLGQCLRHSRCSENLYWGAAIFFWGSAVQKLCSWKAISIGKMPLHCRGWAPEAPLHSLNSQIAKIIRHPELSPSTGPSSVLPLLGFSLNISNCLFSSLWLVQSSDGVWCITVQLIMIGNYEVSKRQSKGQLTEEYFDISGVLFCSC